MAFITTALYIGAGAAVVGAGVSIYGAVESSNAQRSAAGKNAYLSKLQASSTAAVARYQAQLNYNTAMAQSGVFHQNATVLHNAARQTEVQGNDLLARMVLRSKMQDGQTQAAYASSGVSADSGSAVVVKGYQDSMSQLERLDSLYKVNVDAYNKDWQGTMQQYQSDLTAASAQQFLYAEQMANWNERMGIASAGVQQSIANANANATLVQGFGTAVNDIGSAFNSYANAQYMGLRTNPYGAGSGGAGAGSAIG